MSTILAKYIAPEMGGIEAAYDVLRRDQTSAVDRPEVRAEVDEDHLGSARRCRELDASVKRRDDPERALLPVEAERPLRGQLVFGSRDRQVPDDE